MKLKHPGYMNSAWRQNPAPAINGYFQVLTGKATVSLDRTMVTFATSISPSGEVVIAPHGTLTIQSSGAHDPDWRHDMRCLLGVDFDLAKEFAGKLFCPHTKQKVPVGRILGNPVLWCDREHGVALVAGQITYASPEAMPVRTESQIYYSTINRMRLKEFLPRWKRLVNEAKLRTAIMQLTDISPLPIKEMLRKLALAPDVVDIEAAVRISQQKLPNAAPDELRCTAQVCQTITANCERHDLKELISFACADQYQSPYLEYRP